MPTKAQLTGVYTHRRTDRFPTSADVTSLEESLARAQSGVSALAAEEQPVAMIGLVSLIDVYYDSGCDPERAHELLRTLGQAYEGVVLIIPPDEEELAGDVGAVGEDAFLVQEAYPDPRRSIVPSRHWG